MNIDYEIELYKQKIELLEQKKKLMQGKQITEDQLNVIRQNISKRIKKMRKASGIQQSELSELISCSRTSISNIERGEHMPTLPTLLRIVMAIGCNISDILKDSDIRSEPNDAKKSI